VSSVDLDKFATQIQGMREEAERMEPGSASRIQVYLATSSSKRDTTFPDLTNLQQGAHLHRPGEQGVRHTESRSDNWPQCVIIT
jgi:hypothetical protein